MKLPVSAIDLINTFRLGFVATVTAGGRPNVSPKGTFIVLDDETIAFGEIRSPQTVTNLTNQPELEVNFVDQWKRKGVRVRGNAQMVRRGTAEFGGLIDQWEGIWGDLADRINLIVKIPVDQVKPLTTPPYDDGATEEDMIATYKAIYSEIYP
jgi:predicted pyridoxine 5'-phosphate oxidase superfamily flavin-nucleotide-binding protein